MIYLGIDRAEDHRDLCLLDEAGERLAGALVPEESKDCDASTSSLPRMLTARSRSSSASRQIAACSCRAWWPRGTRCTRSTHTPSWTVGIRDPAHAYMLRSGGDYRRRL